MYKFLSIIVLIIYCSSCNPWEEGERYQEGFQKAINGEYKAATNIFLELEKEDSSRKSINSYLKVLEDVQNHKINDEVTKKLFQAFSMGRMSGDTTKLSLIKSAIRLYPEYAISYKELGNVYFYRKDYIDAISNYKKAINLDSTFFGLHYNVALAYDESGNEDEAYRYYKKFVALNPDSNDRYVQYANLRILELESYSF